MLSAASVTVQTPTILLFLLQLTVILLLAVTLGRVAMWLGGAAVMGELLAGVLLGPSVFGHLAPGLQGWLFAPDSDHLKLLNGVAQVGVVLLVGITGAQVDLGMLRRHGATAIRVGVAGFVVPLGLGISAGYLISDRLVPDTTSRPLLALLLGVAMAVSAVPVIAKTLIDLQLVHRTVGQLILTAAVLDDAAGWFLLSIVSATATVGLSAQGVLLLASTLVGFILVAALALRPMVRSLLRRVSRGGDSGLTIGVSVVVIVALAATTQALGMEALFGAFVGGMLVGQPGAAPPALLAPLRTIVLSVLAPIFLASAGLWIDLTTLVGWDAVLWTAALLAIAVVGKFAGAYAGALTSQLGSWERMALGAGMNARGAVEVVIATVGLQLLVFDTTLYTIVIVIAVATSMMAPPLLRLAMARVETCAEEELRRVAQQEWSTPAGRNGS